MWGMVYIVDVMFVWGTEVYVRREVGMREGKWGPRGMERSLCNDDSKTSIIMYYLFNFFI